MITEIKVRFGDLHATVVPERPVPQKRAMEIGESVRSALEAHTIESQITITPPIIRPEKD